VSVLPTEEHGITVAPDIVEVPGYQDLNPVCAGDSATTYRAHREDGDGLVAVKVFSGSLVYSRIGKALNQHWIAARQMPDHPYVLSVLDAGSTYAGQPYVVTAYCEGGSLGDRLSTSGPLGLADVIDYAVPMALALHEIHQVGLCHRGVKPNNILLTADARPVLADLVSAALRAERTITAGGPTPSHTAPEVISGGPSTPAADVYALASTMFHLLGGQPPYADRDGAAGPLLSSLDEAPVPLNRADVPDGLRGLLLLALSAEPTSRPDALEFATQLHTILVSLGLVSSYPTTIWPRPTNPPGPDLEPPRGSSRDVEQRTIPPQVLAPPAAPPATPPVAPPVAPPATPPVAPPVAPPAPGFCPAPKCPELEVDQASPADADAANREIDDDEPNRPTGAGTSSRLRWGLAAVTLAAVGAGVAGFAGFAVSHSDANPASGVARSSPVTPAVSATARPTTLSTASLAPLAPTGVVAIDDGTAVYLRWALPEAAASANVVVQQAPTAEGQPPLTILNPGRRSHVATGLDPARGYCFRVGVLVSIGSGQPGVVSWADPVAVRGTCGPLNTVSALHS
jgi:serine/threonine-protein kinase PknK